MYRAAIDIGSNTVQMLAGEIVAGEIRIAGQYLATTRLGEGGNILSQKSIRDTVEALREIKRQLNEAGISDVRVVATSAVRDAANRRELLNAAREATGIEIEVLTGQEEARLSYLGATAYFKGAPPLVLDIGGGSTEMIWEEEGQLKSVSLDLGAVRAYQNGWTKARIKEELKKAEPLPRDERSLVAVGGTATTAAALLAGITQYSREMVHGRFVSVYEVQQLLDRLSPLSAIERCSYSPLLARRGEIIVDGLLILLSAMEQLDKNSYITSDAGILDGVILSQQK